MPAVKTRAGSKSAARGERTTLLAAANGHLAVALRDHVRQHAENRPGVYRMIGPDGNVVYVGKSVQLRSRLLSYFRADRGAKATDIISAARHIEWEYVPSEFAALLLELRLIQTHRPLLNYQHKATGSMCFIRITPEAAPRVLLATRVLTDGSTYYGPYRGQEMVRALLREVADLLQLRDCRPATPMRFADQLDLFNMTRAPGCIRADLHKCLAPCAGRCTRTEYLTRIRQARRFLEGNVDEPLRLLQGRMEQAAARMQFEYAAELRDRVFRLEGARTELVALSGTLEALTFLYTVPGFRGEDRVYIIRRGSIRAEFPAPRTRAEEQHIMERAARIFRRRERAPATVDPLMVGQILLVSNWFRARPDELARTIAQPELSVSVGQ